MAALYSHALTRWNNNSLHQRNNFWHLSMGVLHTQEITSHHHILLQHFHGDIQGFLFQVYCLVGCDRQDIYQKKKKRRKIYGQVCVKAPSLSGHRLQLRQASLVMSAALPKPYEMPCFSTQLGGADTDRPLASCLSAGGQMSGVCFESLPKWRSVNACTIKAHFHKTHSETPSPDNTKPMQY